MRYAWCRTGIFSLGGELMNALHLGRENRPFYSVLTRCCQHGTNNSITTERKREALLTAQRAAVYESTSLVGDLDSPFLFFVFVFAVHKMS